jgi:anti-anti-sigma regulatory factor
MGIQIWSEGVVLVDLPEEAELERELHKVAELVRDRPDCDVILDFSNVSILSPRCLMTLLKIRRQLEMTGHRLVLSSLVATTWGILSAMGLSGVFEITCDRFHALATVQAHR